MKKKRHEPSEEELARSEAVWRRLRERLEHQRRKLAEEEAQAVR